MSLIEHLEELRKRIIHSAIYLLTGFVIAYAFHERLYGFVQAPLDRLHIPLNFTHPTDGLDSVPEDFLRRWRYLGQPLHPISDLALHLSRHVFP